MPRNLTDTQRKALVALDSKTEASAYDLRVRTSTLDGLVFRGLAQWARRPGRIAFPRTHPCIITRAGAAEARRIRDERAS